MSLGNRPLQHNYTRFANVRMGVRHWPYVHSDLAVGSTAADPIQKQKSARKKRKHFVESIAHRVRIPVNGLENCRAEQPGHEPQRSTRQRNREIEPTKALEPFCLHSMRSAEWFTLYHKVKLVNPRID